MDFVFHPKCCESMKIKGSVTLNIPNYIERKKLIKECGIKITDEGKIAFTSGDHLDFMIKVVEASQRYVKEVSFKHENGKSFSTYEDMMNDPACDKIVEEIASFFINGSSLGE